MKPMLVRTAVAGGTTLLALGLAGPALACPWGPGGSAKATTGASQKDQTLTLAEYQAKADARMATWLTKLADAKTRVADSTKLTDAEKAEKTARLDALMATIEALRVQVAAETSIEAIKADIKAAFAPSVDEVKARIDAKIAAWLTKIDAWESKVAADDSLDPDAKAAKLVKLQAWEDKVVALRAEVAGETTLEGIKADLKAADLHVLWGWGHHFGHHKHGDGRHHGKHSDGKHSNASDPGTRAAGTRTSQVSFSWGGHGGDSGRSGRHSDGWGRGDRDRGGDHGRSGHGGNNGERRSFA